MSANPNPRKGEATLTINGEDYLLCYNFDNLVRLQKQFKVDGPGLFSAIQRIDFEIVSAAIHYGVTEGGQWPDRFGKRAPTIQQLRKEMSFVEVEEYVEVVLEALKGSEFIADVKKKAEVNKADDQMVEDYLEEIQGQ
jgi:hypothetical protein